MRLARQLLVLVLIETEHIDPITIIIAVRNQRLGI